MKGARYKIVAHDTISTKKKVYIHEKYRQDIHQILIVDIFGQLL